MWLIETSEMQMAIQRCISEQNKCSCRIILLHKILHVSLPCMIPAPVKWKCNQLSRIKNHQFMIENIVSLYWNHYNHTKSVQVNSWWQDQYWYSEIWQLKWTFHHHVHRVLNNAKFKDILVKWKQCTTIAQHALC